MSECEHIHDAEGHDVGYICRPGPFYYRVATHRRGARKWEGTGKKHTTIAAAFRDIGKILEAEKGKSWREINRAGIWACEKGISYYDPHQIYEVTVR